MDTFHTLAEVSITFTGLAGIVSVVGRSSLNPEARQWRVWNMILLSLLAFFLSLAPLALSLYSLSGDITWMLCSVTFIIAQISQFYFANRVGNNIGSPSEYTVKSLLVVYYSGSISILIIQLLNVFLLTPGPGPLFAGICWFIFMAALHFFVLVINSDLNKDSD